MNKGYSDSEPELEAIRVWWENLGRKVSLRGQRILLTIALGLWAVFLVWTYPFA